MFLISSVTHWGKYLLITYLAPLLESWFCNTLVLRSHSSTPEMFSAERVQTTLLLGAAPDSYVKIQFQGVVKKTHTSEGTYGPVWNESFVWDVNRVEKGCSTDMVVQVLRQSMLGEEEIGAVSIPVTRMSEIVRARTGQETEETFKLFKKGKEVLGHDSHQCEVTVSIGIFENLKEFGAFGDIETEEASHGPRWMHLTVVSANNLPEVCVYTPSSFITDEAMCL